VTACAESIFEYGSSIAHERTMNIALCAGSSGPDAKQLGKAAMKPAFYLNQRARDAAGRGQMPAMAYGLPMTIWA
jgi:hypothetical protein